MVPEIPIKRFEVYASGLDHPECLAFDWNKRNGWLLKCRTDGGGEIFAGPFGYASGLDLRARERSL